MAPRIIAGVATSHVPAIGAALDLGKSGDDYWAPVFKGYEFSKKWLADQKPDVVILVYNDHASAFSLELIPDLRHRLRRRVPAGRRRLGPAPGAGGQRASGAGVAHRDEHHPRRVRHDHRQQDGRRSRPDGADVAAVRPAEGVAVPRDPARGQRRAVPAAHRPSLLHARQGRSARPSSRSTRI